MKAKILDKLTQARQAGQKQMALLVDPDKLEGSALDHLIQQAESGGVDMILVGGSLMVKDALDQCIKRIKQHCSKPVILFPGSLLQISDQADAILFLSLISGRNPELLIGQQVIAAPYVREAGLEVLPTGYMLVDGGRATTASYMSGSAPLPAHKPEIAACTAMAGEMLGMKLLYLDAGSGADQPASPEMITAIKTQTEAPLLVGGGIKTMDKALENLRAGADVIVIGNATEENPALIADMASAIHNFKA